MAQRTVALCNGKYIGIETIYTVINGRQINIPDKLKALREKSRNNELFCPCGCGTNLVLVAGDKNLREQHYREKSGTGEHECTMPTEGKISINAKIVLKCWLDDKLNAIDIESRVPIDIVEDTKRKTEFTFLSREKKFAIKYWRTRYNIMEEKLDILSGNLFGIKILYIVDSSNEGIDGQYPEALMKLQDKQGFCLLLEIKEADYEKAFLKAVHYEKNLDGFWEEIVFARAKIKEFSIENNNVFFEGKSIEQLLNLSRTAYSKKQQEKSKRRIEQEKLRMENIQRLQEEQERHWKERQRQHEEAEIHRKVFEERCRIEAEKQQEERCQREEEFKHNMEEYFLQQDTPVRDAEGKRWIKCEFCGKIDESDKFSFYGGRGHINLGTCDECLANNPAVKEKAEQKVAEVRKKYDATLCPECGGKMRERRGPYGRFYGCSNFPKCSYKKSIRG